MNINISDITLTGIETISAFHITEGHLLFTLDELQDAKVGQSQEKSDITGKQGRKLGSLKKNKAVSISGTSGIVSAGLMELQTGCEFQRNVETEVMWTDELDVTDDIAHTTNTAVGTLGNELKAIYVKNDNGTLGEPLLQDAGVSAGKFTYDPATKTITMNPGEVADGKGRLVVFYKCKVTGSVLENLSDKYSEKCTLYVDATGEDVCGNIYHVQFYIPKADFDGNFELAMGDSQTVQTFEAEALAGSCGTNGSYWTFTVFGVNTAV